MDQGNWSIPLEEDSMRRELEWLLGQEFTTFATLLQNHLRECVLFITRTRQPPPVNTPAPIDFFGRPSTPTPTPAVQDYDPLDELDDPYWLGVETTGKTVEARLAIEGWFLKEGKIGVRTPKYNKGQPFVANIKQSWKFTQMHNVHNFLVLALEQIHDIVTVQSISASQILRSIDKIQDYLKLANDEFFLNKATYPKSSQSSQVFKPFLPDSLNIQFEIVGTSWVTSVYILQPVQKGSKPAVDTSTSDDVQTRISGYEVAELLQSFKPSKKLETITNYLHNLSQLCCDFREKLVVLSSVDTDGQTEAVQSLR